MKKRHLLTTCMVASVMLSAYDAAVFAEENTDAAELTVEAPVADQTAVDKQDAGEAKALAAESKTGEEANGNDADLSGSESYEEAVAKQNALLEAERQALTAETKRKNLERAEGYDFSIEDNDGYVRDAEGTITGVTIGGETAPVVKEKPAAQEAPVNNDANRITMNLGSDPKSEMNFQWFTTEANPDYKLYIYEVGNFDSVKAWTPEMTAYQGSYIQKTEDGHYIFAVTEPNDEDIPLEDKEIIGYFTDEVFSANNLKWTDKGFEDYAVGLPYDPVAETAYTVNVTGLKPGTRYGYQISKEGFPAVVPIGSFTTAQEGNQPFKFVHYTDTQNAFSSDNARKEAAYSESTAKAILATMPDANFAFHTGDVVNEDYNDSEWVETLSALDGLTYHMPHAFVTGNHDNEYFLSHINTPQELDMTTGVAYSFDYNGAHFTILNTEDDAEGPMISAQQMAWLKADLQAARDKGVDWLIVAAHRPLISSSYHSLQDSSVQAARDELMQVFDNYDVDLVLNGHDHNLTVTYPLVYDPEKFASAAIDEADGVISEGDGVTRFNQANGTVMMIPSTAGTKTYDDIYDKGIDWVLEYEKIHKIIPDLSQADLDYYLSLFAMNEQPFESAYYQTGHSNAREANVQNFFTYDVSADEIIIKLYEVVGEDLNNRATNLVHTYVLSKNAEKPGTQNPGEEDKQDSNNYPGEKPSDDNKQEPDKDPALEENQGQETGDKTNQDQGPIRSGEQTDQDEGKVEAIDQVKKAAAKAEVKTGKTALSSQVDKEEVVSASALPSTGKESTILVGLAALISGCGVLFTKKCYN